MTDERVSVQRMYEKYLKERKRKKELERLVAVQNRKQPEIFWAKIAGIDEADEGLAGPVYAAAVTSAW